jgi:hypothetical protein
VGRRCSSREFARPRNGGTFENRTRISTPYQPQICFAVAMPRIIQDSEDEDEFVVTSPFASPISAPAPSTGNNHAPTSRTKSTNETGQRDRDLRSLRSLIKFADILRREIHNAQQELINASFRWNDSSHPASYDQQSPAPHSPSKRRKTSGAEGNTPLVKKPERRKTLKTYGSSRIQRNEISISELFMNREESTYTNENNVNRVQVEARGRNWDLSASIQDDFARHEPVSMFPDASSTIPDNTLTQKRIIDEALSADKLLPLPNPQVSPPSGNSPSSIPWSDYLATQAVSGCMLSTF